MAIHLGPLTNAKEINIGPTAVQKVLLGDTLVWPALIISLVPHTFPRSYIPIKLDTVGDYGIDWGDGNIIRYAGGSGVSANQTILGYSVNVYAFGKITRMYENPQEVWKSIKIVNGEHFTTLAHICQHDTLLEEFKATDLPLVTSLDHAFFNCNSLAEIPKMNLSQTVPISAWQAFYGCRLITSFPDLGILYTGDLSHSWKGCSALRSFPFIDMGRADNLDGTWDGCSSLTSFPAGQDYRSIRSGHRAWADCSALPSHPGGDFTPFLSVSGLFSGCTNLQGVGQLDTKWVRDFSHMFENCTSLKCLTSLDTRKESSEITHPDRTDLFLNTPLLVAPSASVQETLELYGTEYTNPGECLLPGIPQLAYVTPLDFVSSNTIIVTSTTGFDVDWGDGNRISYGAGTNILVSAVASGDIKVYSNDTTQIKFTTDTYTSINLTDATTLTSMEQMCYRLPNLTSFSASNTGNVTSVLNAWRLSSGLTSFPQIDTANITNFENAWFGCTGLTSFPLIDTSSAQSLFAAWYECSGLTSFPLIDTSAVTRFGSAWAGCSALTSFPAIDTSSGTEFSHCWYNCTNLVCLSSVNTLLQTTTNSMFLNTPALVAPNASEQTLIENGYNYINPGACP